MPEQLTPAMQADGGFEAHCKPTRRDAFLVEMDKRCHGRNCVQ